MLNEAKTLKGYKLNGRDGDIGKVKEFYFDDRHWTVRYLVADTGNWLTGRQVLISPYALRAANREEKEIVVDLSRKQIEGSPSLDSDKPVSRQFEDSYYGYSYAAKARDRTVLTRSANGRTLVSPNNVRGPWVFRVHLALFNEGPEDLAETYSFSYSPD